MANIPQKPVIQNQVWINGQTKLNQTNLTNGVNQNITNLKTAVDGIIDALGGPGGESASDKTLDQTSISDYNPATTYTQGQVVIQNGKYYRAKENGVTGTWDPTKWSQIALSTPVDSALDEDSTNPVQNAAVTAAINGLDGRLDTAEGDIDGLESNVGKIFDDLAPEYSASSAYEVGDYCIHEGSFYKCAVKIASGEAWNAAHWEVANVGDDLKGKITFGSNWFDGTGGVEYSEVAGNLVSTKGLTVNDDPMSFGIVGGAQKSAVGDGNASLNKLVCVDVVKNCYTKPSNSFSGGGLTLTITGNKVVINGTAENNYWRDTAYRSPLTFVAIPHNSKVYISGFDGHNKITLKFIGLAYNGGFRTVSDYPKVYQCDYGMYGFSFIIADGTSFDNEEFELPNIISLTQALGSNEVVNAIIGATASTQVANLIKAFPQILTWTDYDTGTLVPSKTAKLLPVGVNQFAGNSESNPQYIGHYYQNPASSNWAISASESYNCFVIKVKGGEKIALVNDRGTNVGMVGVVAYLDANGNVLGGGEDGYSKTVGKYDLPVNCKFIRFAMGKESTVGICVLYYLDGSSVGFKPYKSKPVTLPNYEGHGILMVVDGKVVADGTELYPDGNSKKRRGIYTFTGNETWDEETIGGDSKVYRLDGGTIPNMKYGSGNYGSAPQSLNNFNAEQETKGYVWTAEGQAKRLYYMNGGYFGISTALYNDRASLVGKSIVYELATEEDITTPVFQSTFPVEQGGTLQFLDEDDNPIAGLQGSEIFYQKNIKAFVEALGEATDWDASGIALESEITDEALAERGYYKMPVLSQTFYSTETVSNLANMGALRTFVNNINSSGRHCFFDLHNYVTDAYVCIVHMWTANGVNYCFVEDLINHKTYGDYSGYTDATTIGDYLSSSAMSSLRVIKITDANITMADVNTLLGEINTLGDHVMFDVSAITSAMYLTTIFISGSYYRVFDSVTGRTAAGNSTSGLTEKLVDVINSGIVNPTSWKDIQQIVREGNAKNVFAPGDQLDVLYLDGISTESSNQSLAVTVNADTFINKMGLSASSYIFTYSSALGSWTLHEGAVSLSTYGVAVTGAPADGNTITVTTTTRTVVFDIVAFDKDVPTDSTYTHSMTIQTHNTVRDVQYSNLQAGFQFPDGLAAGAYCFTIGNYDTSYGGNATYYFTLASAIPAGGQLRFDWPYQQQASTRSVYTYASASSGTAIESKPVSTTEIAGAPNIGTLVNSTIMTQTITDQGGNSVTVKVNNVERMRYGSNNWENSAIRQWCNSAAAAGSVWSPKSDFDRPPSWVSSANGFLYHIDPELLAVCGEVNKITKKSNVCDGGGTVTTTDRAFPVSMGAIGVNGYMDEEPLGQYDYYKALLGGQIADWSTHVELIKKNSAGTAQYWWLRGPYPSYAYYVRIVHTSGYVNYCSADYGFQAAPALSII